MHTSFYPRSATAAVMSSPRENRIESECRRMQHNFAALIAADSRLVDLGPDPIVDQLLSASGFDRRQVFSVRMFIARKGEWGIGRVHSRTAVVASSRIWHCEFDRSQLMSVKRAARDEHVDCVLVPQRTLAGPLRLSTAKAIAHSQSVKYSASDRLRVIAHLQSEGGWSDLEDCSAQISHQDPVGVVLAMVSRGDVHIDRSRPLGPRSRIVCTI